MRGRMSQSVCPSSERLGHLLAGDLPSGEEGPLSAHLGKCPRCQDQVERLLTDDSITTWQRTTAARAVAGPPAEFMNSMRRLVPLVATSSVALGHPDDSPAP